MFVHEERGRESERRESGGEDFMVRVTGSLSQPFPTDPGVLKGSLLGPELFTIFINDLVHCVDSNALLFDDDNYISKKVNLKPLHSRRNVHDLLFLRKFVCFVIDAPDLLELRDFRASRRLRHPLLFVRRHYSTQYMFHSAFPRLQRLANNLPGHLDLISMSGLISA
ncbi:hypothetical protein J6590_081989 [Homalodisca vitripennis]|nr:hypothetical protein J6590_081989 [Homalodisca vitripennis]